MHSIGSANLLVVAIKIRDNVNYLKTVSWEALLCLCNFNSVFSESLCGSHDSDKIDILYHKSLHRVQDTHCRDVTQLRILCSEAIPNCALFNDLLSVTDGCQFNRRCL